MVDNSGGKHVGQKSPSWVVSIIGVLSFAGTQDQELFKEKKKEGYSI